MTIHDWYCIYCKSAGEVVSFDGNQQKLEGHVKRQHELLDMRCEEVPRIVLIGEWLGGPDRSGLA